MPCMIMINCHQLRRDASKQTRDARMVARDREVEHKTTDNRLSHFDFLEHLKWPALRLYRSESRQVEVEVLKSKNEV